MGLCCRAAQDEDEDEDEEDEYADDEDDSSVKSASKRRGVMARGNKAAVKGDAGGKVARPLGGETINIFTVASGHMYERLQKIMMLSVLRRTQSK